MRTSLLCLLSVVTMLNASSALAGKRSLGIEDIGSWKRITETVVSPDGEWIAYKTQPWQGDSKIFLCGKDGKKRFEANQGHKLAFSDDSRFLVFLISPKTEQLRELRLKKTHPDEMPRDELGILNIQSGKLDTIMGVDDYRLPRDWAQVGGPRSVVAERDPKRTRQSASLQKHGGWIAYQVDGGYGPSTGVIRLSNGTFKPTREWNGFALHLRNLEGGDDRFWPSVYDYRFAPKAKRLFYVSSPRGEQSVTEVYVCDVETGKTEPILHGGQDIRQMAVSENGDRVAFLRGPAGNSDKPKNFLLELWSGKGRTQTIATSRDPGVPKGWRINERGRISFSADGKKVFFGTAPVRPERDASVPDDDYPDVDIWHWNEGYLHSVHLANRTRELNRTYRAMVDLETGKLVQIETEEIPESTLLADGNAQQVLLHSSKPYELESMWDPIRFDVYLLDLATGVRQQILKGSCSRVRPSPGGKYLLWYDYADRSYHTYHVASGKRRRITTPKTLRADNETNTTFDYDPPYGVAGWMADDRAVLIYDRYDVWQVDPEGKTRPVNLTITGRRTRTVYRLIRFDGNEKALHEGSPQLLSGFNEGNRRAGYYRNKLGTPAEPRRLLEGDFRLSTPQKAKYARTVVYTKETFEQFPDLFASDLDFRESRRISDANPQQAEFRWGTAELVHWTSLDGRKLDGILFKPEGFDPSRKYPMIVQFFHKSSDQLHLHRTPEFHRSRIDYHFFVSNGYLVFNPDIYFDRGYIGESAYKSIMPGVTALIDKGFVDRERVGLQGHSYSGYQAAYLATRTNLFACIEAGAPVVNFFSAYGGIRWETGRSRAAQYEHDQTLGTIWEVPLRFLENSPLFAMDKVATPILIMHNDADGSVPWTQGIEYFIALRRLRKPAWMLNYNGEGHTLSKLKNKKDFQIRLFQFFGHYLKGHPMPPWMREGVPAVEKDHNLGYESP
ncbi:MAG: S9 family peptidase [Pirellulales bacterium]|nr:S9 family peptidase [Pirellulales bacterium]